MHLKGFSPPLPLRTFNGPRRGAISARFSCGVDIGRGNLTGGGGGEIVCNYFPLCRGRASASPPIGIMVINRRNSSICGQEVVTVVSVHQLCVYPSVFRSDENRFDNCSACKLRQTCKTVRNSCFLVFPSAKYFRFSSLLSFP